MDAIYDKNLSKNIYMIKRSGCHENDSVRAPDQTKKKSDAGFALS